MASLRAAASPDPIGFAKGSSAPPAPQKNPASPHSGAAGFLAEAVGFEPTRAFTLPDFESGPL